MARSVTEFMTYPSEGMLELLVSDGCQYAVRCRGGAALLK